MDRGLRTFVTIRYDGQKCSSNVAFFPVLILPDYYYYCPKFRNYTVVENGLSLGPRNTSMTLLPIRNVLVLTLGGLAAIK